MASPLGEDVILAVLGPGDSPAPPNLSLESSVPLGGMWYIVLSADAENIFDRVRYLVLCVHYLVIVHSYKTIIILCQSSILYTMYLRMLAWNYLEGQFLIPVYQDLYKRYIVTEAKVV